MEARVTQSSRLLRWPYDPKTLVSRPIRFFAGNPRDGARLLSTALVITTIGLVRFDHPICRAIALLAGGLSLYWWLQYRQLSQ